MTEAFSTETFSGAHPFRPEHLRAAMQARWEPWTDEAEEAVADLVKMTDAGMCPRCSGPLPSPPVYPSGSRETDCRCIPICGPCGDHESMARFGTEQTGIYWYPVESWYQDPPDPEDVEEELRVARERLSPRPALLDLQDGKPRILSEDGVTELDLRPDSGGWGKHGYDASQDEDEKRGR
jgi:hypothetical protein